MTALYLRPLSTLAALLLISCGNSAPSPSLMPDDAGRWPALSDVMPCLAASGPIISQHRGRSRETSAADNSLSGLKALRKDGFIMAEIDVARLKDGTHILFHDGVWDDKSTGRGAVASATWPQAERYLLKNPRGQVTSDHPLSLAQLLGFTAGQLYLEIDFKSSANEAQIISQISEAGQIDHSILIAYTRKQALRLNRLAPRAMIAAPVSKIGDIRAYEISGLPAQNIVAWLGTKTFDEGLARALTQRGVLSAYGMMSPKYAKKADYSAASIVVTDYAKEAKTKIGKKTKKDADRLAACILNLKLAE